MLLNCLPIGSACSAPVTSGVEQRTEIVQSAAMRGGANQQIEISVLGVVVAPEFGEYAGALKAQAKRVGVRREFRFHFRETGFPSGGERPGSGRHYEIS
jgi:hypothetical protein